VTSPEATVTVQDVELGLPPPDDLRALWAEDEGALRDIYIEDTTTADWDKVVGAIQERWSCSYSEDGVPVAMPAAAEVLRRRSRRATRLEVHLSERLEIEAHFFEPEQIEFSFLPADARDDADVYRILDFVLHLGRTLGHTVHMTVESHMGGRPPDDLRYEPSLDRIVGTANS
jgi:hypothetical protein